MDTNKRTEVETQEVTEKIEIETTEIVEEEITDVICNLCNQPHRKVIPLTAGHFTTDEIADTEIQFVDGVLCRTCAEEILSEELPSEHFLTYDEIQAGDNLFFEEEMIVLPNWVWGIFFIFAFIAGLCIGFYIL